MRGRQWISSWVRVIYCFSSVAFLFIHCIDARKSLLISNEVAYQKNPNVKHLKILDVAKNLNMLIDVSMKDTSNPELYVSSPFTLPPYDSLSPIPLPDTNPNPNPPYCIYPPPQSTTPPPSTTTPNIPLLTPPSIVPYPPFYEPSPPSSGFVPNPPSSGFGPNPPSSGFGPNPPSSGFAPNPPSSGFAPNPPGSGFVPSPPSSGFAPNPPVFEPPVFQPPVVFPPPIVPPPSGGIIGGGSRVWCVAKPSVPDPILQEAMNYACGSGANCDPIQDNGSCYQPNTPLAHASYAFNSYWQMTKVGGGTCDFGGTAILVTRDPSSQGCKFVSL